MPGTHRGDLLRRAGHLPRHPRTAATNWVMCPASPPHRPGSWNPPPGGDGPARPGLLHHLAHRLVDTVRPRRIRQPTPPIRQRRRVKSLVVQRHPGGDLPPQITPGRLGRLRIREIQQRLQRQNRRRHRRRHRRTTQPRPKQIREVPVRKHPTPMLGQEREHTALSHQVAHHRRSISRSRSARSTPCTR